MGESRFVGCSLDVTDLLNVQQKLRESEARLHGALDGMTEGFGLLALDFTILEFNAAAVHKETRQSSDIIGKTHWLAYPGSEHSEVGQRYNKAMQERVPVTLKHKYIWEDGHVRWLDMRAHPLADGGLPVFWRDITDPKQAEERLRESEDRYRTLFETIGQGYAELEIIRGPDGRASDIRYLLLNPQYERLTGIPMTKAVGRTVLEKFSGLDN